MHYSIGSVIRYSPFVGSPRTVKVIDKSDDIKNRRSGFDGVEVIKEGKDWVELSNRYVWGYDSQIICVVE